MAKPVSRRRFATAVGGALIAAAAAPGVAKSASAATDGNAAPAAASTDAYTQAFLTQYNKIKDPANGYFSKDGIPYHCVETLIVEAPDHGHQTTSEAFSFWFWLEATYGRVSGDWTAFNNAWTTAEHYIIPQHIDQPSNSSYNPSSPATYAPEWPDPSSYPSPLDSSVSVGQDPLASELSSAYGTPDIYGMHWLMDVDNVYGYGNTPNTGAENGPGAGPSYINSYQRGSQESVWETIPQPCTDLMKFGGPNGYLDLFVKQSDAYSKQWKYTNAPDADARAVQAAFWALRWATAQGAQGQVSPSVQKAAKMGDYLRYSMFDKYFKQVGSCTSPSGCSAGSGRSSEHYLLAWYYAWGGAEPGGGWAWRIGDGASHQGYQNPLAAYALSSVASLTPKSPTAQSDWSKSLTRQLEFYRWLQSSEGAIAGGCTNSWNGAYGMPPAGSPTFYGMAYDWEPVYHDPPSNNWFGMQAWSMERVAEYYYVTGDATAKTLLDKWVRWASSVTTVTATSFQIPSDLTWTGQPDTWNPNSPGNNAGLHVSVADSGNDVGVCAAYVKTLTYYAAKSGDAASENLAKSLLDAMATMADSKGIAVSETRKDYNRFGDPVYVPPGWSGKMPNGDVIKPGVTFLDIRSWYKQDKDFPKVQTYLNGGAVPSFTYHRFWAQADIAMAFAVYGELFGGGSQTGDTTPPSAPTNLTVTGTTSSSVSLTWTASTDDVAVTGYNIYRGTTLAGSSTTTSFTDTGLAGSTQYSYTVKAFDAAGNLSAASGAVTATTQAGTGDTTPPSAPTNLTVTGTTSSSVSLSWSPSTDNVGVTGYNVYRGSTLVGSTTTATTFTDTGLTASTAYSYSVKAVDAAGNASQPSNTVTATTQGSVSTGGVKVQYKNNDSAAGDNQIKPGLQLVNTGTGAVTLSQVTIRYYFTGESGASTYSTYIDYAQLGSSNITTKVVAMPSPKTGADHYLEVGFTSSAGSLAAGRSTGDIQCRLNKTDWSNFTEANDYSYGTNTSYADAPKITAYIGGTLAYGTEP